jgi:hypothetical protein
MLAVGTDIAWWLAAALVLVLTFGGVLTVVGET